MLSTNKEEFRVIKIEEKTRESDGGKDPLKQLGSLARQDTA